MRKNILAALALVLLMLGSSGCTTAGHMSRTAARNAQKIVDQFKLAQMQRVEAANAQYQKDYGDLSRALCQLLQQDSEESLDEDAAVLTDSLISDWKTATLPGKFRDTMLSTVQGDYAKLRANEKTLDDARNTYARNYQNASMPLNLLNQIDSDLNALTAPTGWTKDYTKDLDAALTGTWDAYRKTTQEKIPSATSGK
jgi:hypothetical protein